MPTYEYVCSSCKNEWEAEQSIKDPALTECPACHEASARRQISRGTGFILKGSGWYSDLYSSSSNKKPDAASTSSEKSEASTSSETSGTPAASSGDSSPSASTSTSTSAPAAASPSKPTPSTSSS